MRASTAMADNVLEQHDQSANQTCDTGIGKPYGQQKDGAGRRDVIHDQHEQEFPEGSHSGYQTDKSVYNATEHERRYNSQGQDIEENLGVEWCKSPRFIPETKPNLA